MWRGRFKLDLVPHALAVDIVILNLEMNRHGSYSQLSDWQAQYVVLYFLEKIHLEKYKAWCGVKYFYNFQTTSASLKNFGKP